MWLKGSSVSLPKSCMVAEHRYRFAYGVLIFVIPIFSPRPSAMAHPMLRGVAMAVAGDAAVRAFSVVLVGIAAMGDTVAQTRGLCEKRRPPPSAPRGRQPTVATSLSIHSHMSDGITRRPQQHDCPAGTDS